MCALSDAVVSAVAPGPRPHAVKRNVLASWVAHAVTLVCGFFLMPYVIDVLGDQQYGTWVLINSIAAYSGVLYLGFGETISRYVATYEAENRPDRVNKVVTLVLAVYGVMGTLGMLIAGGLAWFAPWMGIWSADELLQVRIVILILGLNFTVGLCGSVFGGVLVGLRRFDLERGVGLISDFIRLTLIFVFLSERWGIVTIAAIYLFITCVEQVLFFWLAFRIYPPLAIRPAFLKWSVFRECSGFSSMALTSNIAHSLINTTDSVVIGFMLGAEAIVPYYIALRLTQFIRQPIDKIAHICMPTAGALAVETESRRLLNFLVTALGMVFLLIGGMFIGAWFFGGDLIHAWMHHGYPITHRILCILLGAQLIVLPCGILRAFLLGTGRVKVPGLLYLVETVFNLGLSVLLCHWYGIIGVAWGTVIPAVIFELGLLLLYALKALGLSFRRLWTEAVLPQLPPLAAYSWYAAQQPWSHTGWPALIGITLGGGAVLGSTWLGVRYYVSWLERADDLPPAQKI